MSVEETLAREDDLLSTYSHQSPPPSKKRKPDVCEDVDATLSNKAVARNPFCMVRSNTDDSIKLRPLTEIVSPVKKPTMMLSPRKTPTKLLSPAKKANIKVAKRKLATNTIVLSRFFKRPAEVKTDKETEIAGNNSDQIEIKEKFLHVKSLYEKSVNNALSLYSDAEPNVEGQEYKTDCKTSSPDNVKSEDIVEIKSDTEEDEAAIKKTLNKFIQQKEVSSKLYFY